MPQKKGVFLTIYGINNIGKSTQARRLVERLQADGYDAVLLKYPVYDLEPTGSKLNEILRSQKIQIVSEEELQTLFMHNRRDFEPQLKRMLAEGNVVVAEDYTGTGIAWGNAKGLDLSWLENLNRHLLKEDFSVLLRGKRHVDAREANHLHEQNDRLVEKVDQILVDLSAKYGWKLVESSGSIDEVSEALWTVVRDALTQE